VHLGSLLGSILVDSNVALPDYLDAFALPRDRHTMLTICCERVRRTSRGPSRHHVRYVDWWHALQRLIAWLLLPLESLLLDSVQLLPHIVRHVIVTFELVAYLRNGLWSTHVTKEQVSSTLPISQPFRKRGSDWLHGSDIKFAIWMKAASQRPWQRSQHNTRMGLAASS